MITEDYVSFETAKLLKEKGFDESCYREYHEANNGYEFGFSAGQTNSMWDDEFEYFGVQNYAAPTLQMAMKWLREVYKLHITVYSCSQESWAYIITKPHQTLENGAYAGDYASCEEACEAAVKYCLKNLI